MTGPEHYVEAERLLFVVDAMQERIQQSLAGGVPVDQRDIVRTEQAMATVAAAALAHAQLATAAAAALHKVGAEDKWLDVAG